MNYDSSPSLSETGDAGAGEAFDEAAARTGRHLGMLAELAEIGMRLAREVERRALAEEPRRDALPDRARLNSAEMDWGLVFARIARAVRQTVALEARLAGEAQAQAATVPASQAAAGRKRSRRIKERVRVLAEEAIGAEADGHEVENMRLDLAERLDDPDIEAELGRRPIGVIFAAICRDLGITPDLSGFTDAELGFEIKTGDGAGRGSALYADFDRTGLEMGAFPHPGPLPEGEWPQSGWLPDPSCDSSPLPWPDQPGSQHDPP